MKAKTVTVSDRMQRKYRYALVAPAGRGFAPSFKPELSPKEMLELGVFGGVYMRDCGKEFPKSWFARAKFQEKGSYIHDPALNYFGMNASQPLSVWRAKGWINEVHDPRGWFQWYCRYYQGRRLPEEDEKQIRRWLAMRRHISQIKKHCNPSTTLRTGTTGKLACRARQRQALLHWAYDSRKY